MDLESMLFIYDSCGDILFKNNIFNPFILIFKSFEILRIKYNDKNYDQNKKCTFLTTES